MNRVIGILFILLSVSVFSNYELTELNEELHAKMYFSESSSNNSSGVMVVPAVDLQCLSPNPSGAIDVPVYPGATLTGYATCKVTNPNQYVERIEIEVDADGLVVAAPGGLTLGPGSESEFQVTVRAEQRMSVSGRTLEVTARVVEANGVPPPDIAESKVQMIINILQFSRLQVDAVTPFLEIDAGDDVMLKFKIHNQGNSADTFSIRYLNSNNIQDLELYSQINKISIDVGETPTEVEVNLIAPEKLSNLSTGPKGERYIDALVEITVESDFSCRYEPTGCNSMSQMVTVRIYSTGSELCGDEISSATTSVLIYGGIANVVFILGVLIVVFVLMKSRTQYTELLPLKNYPSVEDVAQSFDDSGYEWIKLDDGTSFYRQTGSEADWIQWEN